MDRTEQGDMRESIAKCLQDRQQAIDLYQVYYQRALAVMASGAYKDPDNAVTEIAGKIADLLYNRESSQEPAERDLNSLSMSEIKDLWQDMVGEEWPDSESSS